jgi:hypothetical protein
MALCIMIRSLLCTVLFLSASWGALAQPSVQLSHIEGNVPAPEDFAPFLQRDILSFAKTHGAPTATRVEYKLLRDAPTQSGVAYPKFYAWVQVFGDRALLSEGAVRVAAIERTRFDVTDFVRAQEIRTNPGAVQSVFPRLLVAGILERAGSK